MHLLYTALRADAGTYYINGNWRIQLPGDVQADGTVFRYMRKGTLEKIISRGPTNAPLHIMVSFAWGKYLSICWQ